MSTIDIQTASTIPGQITTTQAKASTEALYGPWENIDLDDFSWMDDFFPYQNHDDFIGLTIGVKDNGKVIEYQLEKQDGEYVFVEKSAGITSGKITAPLKINDTTGKLYLDTNAPIVTNSSNKLSFNYDQSSFVITGGQLKPRKISDNGTGVIQALQLQDYNDENDVAQVYYAKTTPSEDGKIKQDCIYIKKADMSDWFNPKLTAQYGIALSSDNKRIGLNVSGAVNGSVLTYDQDNDRVIWSKNTSGVTVAPYRGLEDGANGLGLKLQSGLSGSDGYLHWNGTYFDIQTPPSSSSGSIIYTGIAPIVTETESRREIRLQQDFIPSLQASAAKVYGWQNKTYGWYTLDNFYLNGTGIYTMNMASEEKPGVVNATKRKTSSSYRLEEVDGEWRYIEHIVVDDPADPSKPISQQNDFIAAECVLIDDESNKEIFKQGSLYADLTEFVPNGATFGKNCYPVKFAIEDDNDNQIKRGQFFVDIQQTQTWDEEEDETIKAAFVYVDNDENASAPSTFDSVDMHDFDEIRQDYHNSSLNHKQYQISKDPVKLQNIEELYIDPVGKGSSAHYTVLVDLEDTSTDCLIETYQKVLLSGNLSSIQKVVQKQYLEHGHTYTIDADPYPTPEYCKIKVTQQKRFSDL